MQTNNVQNLKDEIPKTNQEEVKVLYRSSREILKTYYKMFPPKNADQEQKVSYKFYFFKDFQLKLLFS